MNRRFTSSLLTLELDVPSGSPEKGTGLGRWVIAPGGALALNPTDLFPVYIEGRYKHSIGGGDGEPVRSLQLNVEAAQILPKGFYLAIAPTFFFDLHQNTETFLLSVAVGRALTRNFGWAASYSAHVAGAKRFNHNVTLALSFIWGDEKVKSR